MTPHRYNRGQVIRATDGRVYVITGKSLLSHPDFPDAPAYNIHAADQRIPSTIFGVAPEARITHVWVDNGHDGGWEVVS